MGVDFLTIEQDGAEGLTFNAAGSVADKLLESGGDVNVLRPFRGRDGRSYVTQYRTNAQGVLVPVAVPVTNANATLRKDDWIQLDQAIIRAAKPRLKAVADLRSAGSEFVMANGMGKTVLEYERVSDISEATVSMDGVRESQNDRPVFDLAGLPLPIIHKDFSFHTRQILASRNGGSPLDTTMAELAARRVAEEAEKMLIGTSSYAYAGRTLYGYTNFPSRITKTITSPLAGGWVPKTILTEVLDMQQKSIDKYHYGPWDLYFSTAWNKFLGEDYILTGGNVATQTLKQRLEAIDGINSVSTLDYLTGYQCVLVQRTPDVARMVIGMEMMTIQWDSHGGMKKNFKVMAIMVPQLRADFNGNTGIVHGAP